MPSRRVNAFLSKNAHVKQAITWEEPGGLEVPFEQWSSEQKHKFYEDLASITDGVPIELDDPPPNALVLQDDEFALSVLAEEHAWPLYVAHVANSLYIEIWSELPWSMADLTLTDARTLLQSRSFFQWNNDLGGYQLFDAERTIGRVLPAPPQFIHTFLEDQDIVGTTRRETIGRLLEWCRDNLSHFTGGMDAQNVEDQWQYRGFPPVTRIINGTPRTSNPAEGIRHRTAGCHGTAGFLQAVLRVINIPSRRVLPTSVGHATPHFPSESAYLSHGDDPYNRHSRATPPYPGEELLIDSVQYETWFGDVLTADERLNNIGRRVYELAIVHLSNYLLQLHCGDLAAGRDHNASDVAATFARFYTVAELEAMNLWQRLDDRVTSFGGCDNIP